LPGWTEESHKNTSVRIARIRVEMWTRDFPYTKQDHDVR
jgi:hypothetical protein